MLGDNIRKIMKDKRITSKELSNIVGVTPAHISYILNDRRDPSMELLNKLSVALDVSVNDFFDEDIETTKEITGKSIKEYLPVIPREFTNPDEARIYVNKHQIFGANGFDSDKLSDDEILEFANELLKQMELISFKYKK